MRSLSRDAWVAQAFDALAAGGLSALSVEPLAKRLGVTKGSFYHHFSDRRALHLAMLESWEQLGTTEIIEAVDAAAAEPAEALRRLAHRTMQADPRSDAIENAIRAWAAADEIAAAAVARVDGRRLEYVADLLRASGHTPALARRRARLFYRSLIGEFVWRSAGGPIATRSDIDDAITLVLS